MVVGRGHWFDGRLVTARQRTAKQMVMARRQAHIQDGHLGHGAWLAREAVRADHDGQHEVALEVYKSSLALLFAAMAELQNPSELASLKVGSRSGLQNPSELASLKLKSKLSKLGIQY